MCKRPGGQQNSLPIDEQSDVNIQATSICGLINCGGDSSGARNQLVNCGTIIAS